MVRPHGKRPFNTVRTKEYLKMNLTFQQNDGSWIAVRRISAFVRLAFLCLVSAHLASKVLDRVFFTLFNRNAATVLRSIAIGFLSIFGYAIFIGVTAIPNYAVRTKENQKFFPFFVSCNEPKL